MLSTGIWESLRKKKHSKRKKVNMRKHFAWNPRIFLGTHDFLFGTHDFFLGNHPFLPTTFYPRQKPTTHGILPTTHAFLPTPFYPRLLASPVQIQIFTALRVLLAFSAGNSSAKIGKSIMNNSEFKVRDC